MKSLAVVLAILMTGCAMAQDVPAVKEKTMVQWYQGVGIGKDIPPIASPECNNSWFYQAKRERWECWKTEWTCADKMRILLTAENGKRWCYKPRVKP